jgi:hypothetical protein
VKRAGLFLLAVSVITLVFSASAFAQGDNSVYFVTYYSNNVSGAPDGTVRFINDGDTGSDMYVDIWVFDDSQELQACGACEITPDGILSEDVKTELTNNTLTGRVPARGVIKAVSIGLVGETDPPTPGVRAWATHIQRASATSGAYSTTEAPFADSNFTESEFLNLLNLCDYLLDLGSGQGQITCTPEDHDF